LIKGDCDSVNLGLTGEEERLEGGKHGAYEWTIVMVWNIQSPIIRVMIHSRWALMKKGKRVSRTFDDPWFTLLLGRSLPLYCLTLFRSKSWPMVDNRRELVCCAPCRIPLFATRHHSVFFWARRVMLTERLKMRVAVSVEYRILELVVADPDRVLLPRCRQLIRCGKRKGKILEARLMCQSVLMRLPHPI